MTSKKPKNDHIPKKQAPATQNAPGPETSGIFEVDMFPSDVDSVRHPYVEQFKEMLEEVAREYNCRLVNFQVHKGTTRFSFDSDILNAEIMRMLQRERDR
ncbi:MAG: hypothetical protein R6U38_14180 [Desulfatiglandaceae bacterium]